MQHARLDQIYLCLVYIFGTYWPIISFSIVSHTVGFKWWTHMMYTKTIANNTVYELAKLHFVSRPTGFTLYTQELIKVSYYPIATNETMTEPRILDGLQEDCNAHAETSIITAHNNSKNMLILSSSTSRPPF